MLNESDGWVLVLPGARGGVDLYLKGPNVNEVKPEIHKLSCEITFTNDVIYKCEIQLLCSQKQRSS